MQPDTPARWRAIEVGPGGVSPELIRPTGPDADRRHRPGEPPGAVARPGWVPPPSVPRPVSGPMTPHPTAAPQLHWADRPVGFGRGEAGGRRRRILGALAVLVAILTAVGAGLWADSVRPGSPSGAVVAATGDCLQTDGAAIAAIVDCGSATATFRVVTKFTGNTDGSACSAAPSDVVLVTREPAALCLDYVATVGDCLFAGPATTRIGKIPCTATQPGVLRVVAVLGNTIDPRRCPAGTETDLVHLHDSEVVCLARP